MSWAHAISEMQGTKPPNPLLFVLMIKKIFYVFTKNYLLQLPKGTRVAIGKNGYLIPQMNTHVLLMWQVPDLNIYWLGRFQNLQQKINKE